MVLGLACWNSDAAARLYALLLASATPQLQVPAGWPAPHYDFADNRISRAGFELGRHLFYDPILSRDDSIACGSCHQQFAAFAHLDHRVSHGIGGINGKRNAPALFNLAWQPNFMWDGAVHQLELQPIAPISNPVEMDEQLDHVIGKLQADARYPAEFRAAFGSDGIDSQRLFRALAQFIGTLVSADSRYDRYRAGREHLSTVELQGLQVFREHCASCHREPLFTDYSFRNNGLDRTPQDRGRADVTNAAADEGAFRVPSLRNVELTAPYMHDGRYATLDQVLDHYIDGVQPSATLDPRLAGGIQLNAAERDAVLQFLRTLTDAAFVNDPRFAEIHE
ncbi:MAG: cytochrome-c peroxidase [Nevskia sp.]|nr:cytochrome-c peroxidase [Nevskia sp.]